MRSDIFRKRLIDKLTGKRLVVLGYQSAAIDFVKKYRSNYNIAMCVTFEKNYPERIIVGGVMYRVLSWEEYEYSEEDYLILAEGVSTWMENRLASDGLSRYMNYIDSVTASVIMCGKKVAIVAGNCQIVTIHDFLSQIPEFTEQYVLCRFSTHYWKDKYSLEATSVLRHFCSLYICLKHESNDTHFFLREELPEDCQIVTLASYLAPLYWPQISRNRAKAYNDLYMKNPNMSGHGTYEFGDVNINVMIKEGYSVEQILEAVCSETFYDEEIVHKHVKRILRAYELAEVGCDIQIADYISEHYLDKMLMRDFVHMQVDLIWVMVRELLVYLGVKTDSMERIQVERSSEVCEKFRTHCTEIPIYPSVAKALGLKWCKEKKYEVIFPTGVKRLSFEEYIQSYVDVCRKCKELMEI